MLVVDASPLIAIASAKDEDRERCADILGRSESPPQVPALVAAEAAYVIGTRIGSRAELAFARSFQNGELFLEPVEPADWERITELMEQYLDLPLGLADASVIALAERLGAKEIATLDHRHFSIVKPRHIDAFTLLP